MKTRIGFVLLMTLLTTCVGHDIGPALSENYFVFGLYGGYCSDSCVQIFVADNGRLYEAQNAKVSSTQQPMQLSQLRQRIDDDFQSVNSFRAQVPAALAARPDHVIGCPGCADGQGLYLELKVEGEKRFWYIDPCVQDVELSPFVIALNEKLLQLTQ